MQFPYYDKQHLEAKFRKKMVVDGQAHPIVQLTRSFIYFWILFCFLDYFLTWMLSLEFQNFLRDLLREAKKSQEVSEDELIQYTDTMLQVFDSNKDGKLQLSEMAK